MAGVIAVHGDEYIVEFFNASGNIETKRVSKDEVLTNDI